MRATNGEGATLFLLTVTLAAVMPALPEPTDPRALAFATAAGLLLATWAARSLMRGAWPRTASGGWLLGFLMMVLLSVLTASLFETPLHLWLRGAIPFVFLSLFFPAFALARRDPNWVLDAVCLSAVVWLIHTTIAAGRAIPAVLAGDVIRITHATDAWALFQLPYAMVGLALVLFHPPRWIGWLRWPLAGCLSIVPILAVSRGQIGIVALIWMLYLVKLPRTARLRAAIPVLVVMSVVTLLVAQSELAAGILERFATTGIESERSRLTEVRYAVQQFRASPLLGKGLGYQIPGEITFAGDVATMVSAGVESVGYMHNVVGYLLMDLGLAGAFTYAGFLLATLRRRGPVAASTDGKVWLAGAVIVMALVAWSMVQASFRLIQTNLLLATTAAALSATQARRRTVAHARSS